MNIVFLQTTYDYGHRYEAANIKTELLARGLKAGGNFVTIHNGVFGVREMYSEEEYEIPEIGRIINYSSSGSKLFDFIRNFSKLKSDLLRLKDDSKKNILVLLSPNLLIYEEYLALGKYYGYKVVVISHEWVTTFHHKNFLEKYLRKAFSIFFGYGVDAILPISDFIIEKVKHFNKPMLKTPILGDFSSPPSKRNRYTGFVYCGTIQYQRAFMTLIAAYKIYCQKVDDPLPLTLILSGNENKIRIIEETVASEKIEKLRILSKIPYEELYEIFRSASALLLPLDPNNIQDKARFSQKIAEYISTGTPLVTTPVGEIPNYFKDRENAIFNDYTKEGFADSMKWVHCNPAQIEIIGESGWEVGKKEFDYIRFGKKLNDFLKSL